MSAGISIREFARRESCNEKLVRRAIADGYICKLPDGKISSALVGSGWRKSNRHADTADKGADTLSAPALTDEVVSALNQIVADNDLMGMPLAEAERLKENALARLRQLEFDTKSGAVVAVTDVARTVGEAFARVRTRLLALPAEQAPRIHRCKTPAEVQDALMDVIVQALEELSAGESAVGK